MNSMTYMMALYLEETRSFINGARRNASIYNFRNGTYVLCSFLFWEEDDVGIVQ